MGGSYGGPCETVMSLVTSSDVSASASDWATCRAVHAVDWVERQQAPPHRALQRGGDNGGCTAATAREGMGPSSSGSPLAPPARLYEKRPQFAHLHVAEGRHYLVPDDLLLPYPGTRLGFPPLSSPATGRCTPRR